jgi:hypothetical protein
MPTTASTPRGKSERHVVAVVDTAGRQRMCLRTEADAIEADTASYSELPDP